MKLPVKKCVLSFTFATVTGLGGCMSLPSIGKIDYDLTCYDETGKRIHAGKTAEEIFLLGERRVIHDAQGTRIESLLPCSSIEVRRRTPKATRR